MANYSWLETLLATTVDHAVILMDDKGCILEWLGASERIFGYTASEAVGQRSSLLFTAEDVQQGLDEHEIDVAMATGRSEDDRWHRRKDHVNFWGSGVLARVAADDPTRTLLCKVVRDRTDIRSQVTMLENLVAARDAEIERRSRFMATTFHELSNPLNPMVMAVELLGHTRPTGLAEQVDESRQLMLP